MDATPPVSLSIWEWRRGLATHTEKLLINFHGSVHKAKPCFDPSTGLRTRHERDNRTDFVSSSVRPELGEAYPELVEGGGGRVFQPLLRSRMEHGPNAQCFPLAGRTSWILTGVS